MTKKHVSNLIIPAILLLFLVLGQSSFGADAEPCPHENGIQSFMYKAEGLTSFSTYCYKRYDVLDKRVKKVSDIRSATQFDLAKAFLPSEEGQISKYCGCLENMGLISDIDEKLNIDNKDTINELETDYLIGMENLLLEQIDEVNANIHLTNAFTDPKSKNLADQIAESKEFRCINGIQRAIDIIAGKAEPNSTEKKKYRCKNGASINQERLKKLRNYFSETQGNGTSIIMGRLNHMLQDQKSFAGYFQNNQCRDAGNKLNFYNSFEKPLFADKDNPDNVSSLSEVLTGFANSYQKNKAAINEILSSLPSDSAKLTSEQKDKIEGLLGFDRLQNLDISDESRPISTNDWRAAEAVIDKLIQFTMDSVHSKESLEQYISSINAMPISNENSEQADFVGNMIHNSPERNAAIHTLMDTKCINSFADNATAFLCASDKDIISLGPLHSNADKMMNNAKDGVSKLEVLRGNSEILCKLYSKDENGYQEEGNLVSMYRSSIHDRLYATEPEILLDLEAMAQARIKGIKEESLFNVDGIDVQSQAKNVAYDPHHARNFSDKHCPNLAKASKSSIEESPLRINGQRAALESSVSSVVSYESSNRTSKLPKQVSPEGPVFDQELMAQTSGYENPTIDDDAAAERTNRFGSGTDNRKSPPRVSEGYSSYGYGGYVRRTGTRTTQVEIASGPLNDPGQEDYVPAAGAPEPQVFDQAAKPTEQEPSWFDNLFSRKDAADANPYTSDIFPSTPPLDQAAIAASQQSLFDIREDLEGGDQDLTELTDRLIAADKKIQELEAAKSQGDNEDIRTELAKIAKELAEVKEQLEEERGKRQVAQNELERTRVAAASTSPQQAQQGKRLSQPGGSFGVAAAKTQQGRRGGQGQPSIFPGSGNQALIQGQPQAGGVIAQAPSQGGGPAAKLGPQSSPVQGAVIRSAQSGPQKAGTGGSSANLVLTAQEFKSKFNNNPQAVLKNSDGSFYVEQGNEVIHYRVTRNNGEYAVSKNTITKEEFEAIKAKEPTVVAAQVEIPKPEAQPQRAPASVAKPAKTEAEVIERARAAHMNLVQELQGIVGVN